MLDPSREPCESDRDPLSVLSLPKPSANTSSAASSSLYVTFKVLQLIKNFRKRFKTRVPPAAKRRDAASKHKSVKESFCRDLDREVSEEIDKYLGKSPRTYPGTSNRPAPSILPAAPKQETDLRRLLDQVSGAVKYKSRGLLSIASQDATFLDRKDDFDRLNKGGLIVQDLVPLIVIVKDLLHTLSHISPSRGCTDVPALCEGNETLDPQFDESYLANLLHLLLCLQSQLVRSLVDNIVGLLRKDLIECQREQELHRRGDQCFFEFPGVRHPLSTTWPWNLRPSLAVLWGVCWMFYDHTPLDFDFDQQGNMVDSADQVLLDPWNIQFFLDQNLPQTLSRTRAPIFGQACQRLMSAGVQSPLSPQAQSQPPFPSQVAPMSASSPARSPTHPYRQSVSFPNPFSGDPRQQVQATQYTHTLATQSGVTTNSCFAQPDTLPCPPYTSGGQAYTYAVTAAPHPYASAAISAAGGPTQRAEEVGGGLPEDENFASPSFNPPNNVYSSAAAAAAIAADAFVWPSSAQPLPRQQPQARTLASSGFDGRVAHPPLQPSSRAPPPFITLQTHCTDSRISPQDYNNNQILSAVSSASSTLPDSNYAAPSHNLPYGVFLGPGDARSMNSDQREMQVTPPRSPHPTYIIPDHEPITRKRSHGEMSGDVIPQSARSRSGSMIDMQQPQDGEDEYASPRSRPFKRGDPPVNHERKYICDYSDECADLRFDRKCEWSKHMDKHDRPYRCQHASCAKLQGFTYSGGLLRHEREVHGKHGGPKAQLMCPHEECKRHSGKGFTRKENLTEHIRRVHNGREHPGAPLSAIDASLQSVGVDDSETPASRYSEAAVAAAADGLALEDPTALPYKRRRYDGPGEMRAGSEEVEELRQQVLRLQAEHVRKDADMHQMMEDIRLLKEQLQMQSQHHHHQQQQQHIESQV